MARGSDDELPALARVFAAARETKTARGLVRGTGGVGTATQGETAGRPGSGGERVVGDAGGRGLRVVRRRVLRGVADNPLLRPLGKEVRREKGGLSGLGGMERRSEVRGSGGVGRKKDAVGKEAEDEGLARETMSVGDAQRTRKEKIAEIVDVRILSDDEDVPVSKPRRPRRAKTSRTLQAEVFEEEKEELSCLEDDSDGMSDFIVDDSSLSEEEEEDDEEEEEDIRPAPRSVRKLVRGRRPESLPSAQNQKPTQPPPALLLDWSDDDAVEERRPAPLPVTRRLFSKEKEDPFCISEEESPILTFDPAEDRAARRPSKEIRFATPPPSPQKTQKGLVSPKKLPRIPAAPHRQSMDDFWQPDVVNDWNDEFSPRKQLNFNPSSHDSIDNDNTVSSPKKSPVKKDKAALAAKKGFLETRHAIADSFLKELDDTLTHGQIAEITASTGGVKIIWSKKLVTTAGRAHWRREAVRSMLSSSTAGSAIAKPAIAYSHHASIELAEKVIDDTQRLLNVLAHEFCHLANFMISRVTTNPHGREFKAWAAKCSRAFGDRGIEVTTKHSYEIEYKYIWACTKAGCAMEYKRHSKSIDVRTERCGKCRGHLVQTRPVPRGGGGMGEYQAFVKEHMARVRSENPGSPQKEIMGLVGKRYQEYKATRLRESVAQSVGGEVEVGADPVDVLVKKINFLDLTSP